MLINLLMVIISLYTYNLQTKIVFKMYVIFIYTHIICLYFKYIYIYVIVYLIYIKFLFVNYSSINLEGKERAIFPMHLDRPISELV